MKYFDCPFCPLSAHASSLNTRLLVPETASESILENDLCVVVADAAPIRAGHALVVLKEHETSAFGAEGGSWQAIAELCTEMERRIVAKTGLPVVIWEHGSILSDASSGCIEHAHVHMLPAGGLVRQGISNLVGKPLECIDDPARFVSQCKSQYLILRDINGNWYGQTQKIFESQLFRKALAHTGDLKLDRWQQYFTDKHIDNCRSLFLESRDLLM